MRSINMKNQCQYAVKPAKQAMLCLSLFVILFCSTKLSAQVLEPFLVKDINPAGASFPLNLADFNGTAYFLALTLASGFEVWRSDGTDAGTTILKDIDVGSGSGGGALITAVGDTLYFVADDKSGKGQELWKSDGTAQGTTMVKEIRLGSASPQLFDLTAVGSRLFFRATNGSTGSAHGQELWVSDGTPDGTVMVKDINPGTILPALRILLR